MLIGMYMCSQHPASDEVADIFGGDGDSVSGFGDHLRDDSDTLSVTSQDDTAR